MTTDTRTIIRAGTLAGLAATLLALGASGQSAFASVVYAASALPILVAGLGWGNRAAIAGIVTALALASLMVSPLFAAAMAAFTLIPAGWLAHLANLARPASELGGPGHLMAWYPISDILLHLCGLVTMAVIALGTAIGYGPELAGKLVEAMAETLKTQDPAYIPDAAAMAMTRDLILPMLPIVQAGLWVMLLFAALYIALRIVSRSGRALRPREDMPSALRMNRHAIFIFLAGILMTLAGGVTALIGATICGAFGAGFLMAGFASLHLRTRGKDWRVPALVLAYVSALFALPALAILILGLADTRRAIALTPARPSTQNDQNDS